jgi:hypothetical protein
VADPGDVMLGIPGAFGHMCAGAGHGKPGYGCGGYKPYPAALANSAAALSAARFLNIRLMEETEGAVAFVHTPVEIE